MNKIVFALVGQIASGKDVAKRYLEEKYGAKNCKFSTILRDVLSRLFITVNRENLQVLSIILRKNFGENLLAKVIAEDVKNLDTQIVVLDGVRRMADLEFIKTLDNYVLIKIEADPKIRYDRCVTRNENEGDDKKTFEEFMKDHEVETEVQIADVMRNAKYSINNDGGLQELYSQIDKIVEQALNKK